MIDWNKLSEPTNEVMIFENASSYYEALHYYHKLYHLKGSDICINYFLSRVDKNKFLRYRFLKYIIDSYGDEVYYIDQIDVNMIFRYLVYEREECNRRLLECDNQ